MPAGNQEELTRIAEPMDATTLDLDLSEVPFIEEPEATSDACLIQIHPVVGRCGVRHLGSETIIGRDKDADFSVQMDAVSRHHAKVERMPNGRYKLTDLNSTNGTFVNDVRVREWELQPGDMLRCGGAILKVLPADDLEARYHEVAYMMMTHDSLTGLHNRQYFDDILGRDLARSARYKEPLSVLMIDLDHFKAVNDLHGHLAGDDVLREFARRARLVLRGECILARIGGEEFGVIVQQADVDEARNVAERIRCAISSRKFRVTDGRIGISVSVGVAATDGKSTTSADEILRLADQNLYEAKNRGRDCIFS